MACKDSLFMLKKVVAFGKCFKQQQQQQQQKRNAFTSQTHRDPPPHLPHRNCEYYGDDPARASDDSAGLHKGDGRGSYCLRCVLLLFSLGSLVCSSGPFPGHRELLLRGEGLEERSKRGPWGAPKVMPFKAHAAVTQGGPRGYPERRGPAQLTEGHESVKDRVVLVQKGEVTHSGGLAGHFKVRQGMKYATGEDRVVDVLLLLALNAAK